MWYTVFLCSKNVEIVEMPSHHSLCTLLGGMEQGGFQLHDTLVAVILWTLWIKLVAQDDDLLDSLRWSVTYMHQYTRPPLLQIMACRQTGDKPSSEFRQTGDKLLFECRQTGDKPLSECCQTGDKPLSECCQTGDKPLSECCQTGDKPLSECCHTSDKPLSECCQIGGKPLSEFCQTDDKPLSECCQTSDKPGLMYGFGNVPIFKG